MEWVIAGLTVFGTVASVTGVVLYVFNGTKKLIEKIDERTAKMEEEFIKLDERFAKLDERYAKIDERYAKIDERFAEIDERYAKLDERYAKLDERYAKLDERFAKLDERAEERHQEVIALLKRLTDLIEMRIPIPNSATNPGTTKRKRISKKSKKR